MNRLRRRYGKISPVGAGDSAVGSCDFIFSDPVKLFAVQLDFTGQENTTDVTITSLGRTIQLSNNSNADALLYPREQAQDKNAAAITGVYAEPVLGGTATVSVAQGSASTPGLEVALFYYDF